MDKQSLQEFALRLGAFVEMLEKQAASAANDMNQSGQALTRTAQGITGQIQQLSESVVSTVKTESRDAIEAGAKEGIAPALEKLQRSIRTLQDSSQTLHAQTRAMQGTQRTLIWISSLALLLGSLLAAGGSSYLVWKNQKELKRAEFARDLFDAARSGAINHCAGQLCVRTGSTPTYYEKNREYVLVK